VPQPKGCMVSPLPPHLIKIMAQKTYIGEEQTDFILFYFILFVN
jgi:hypothetical protein